jgi:small ligand-binding sensory domain FIST
MTARCAAALSEHPVATEAVGEVVGEVLDTVGAAPDLAALFVTTPHTGALEDMAPAVAATLEPKVLVGATAGAVLAGRRGVEETAAVALWAGRLDAPVRPTRLTARQTPDGWSLEGLDNAGDDGTLVVVADPFTFPVAALLDEARRRTPGLRVIGGLASAARRPGGNRLVLDGALFADGAVGALVSPGPDTVVSQGCRPIGQPLTVTRADGRLLLELGGRPALERLMATLEALPEHERALAASGGLHCGIVVDEHKVDFSPGDFVIRGVLGVDREQGAVAVGDDVDTGAVVQFQVRDAATAGEDLMARLSGRHAGGALVFTCNGRGTAMFGSPHHDAAVLQDVIGPVAAAGMSCAGEIGPVGGRNVLHGFTASIALF